MRLARDRRSGLLYRVGSNDQSIIREATRNYHELPIAPRDIMLDLGAHVGTASHLALIRGASSVAVEADPGTFRVLQRNLRHPKALTIGAAVGDRAGMTVLYARPDKPQLSTLIANDDGRRAVRVPMLGLGDLIAQYRPTILKCDIEFGEYALSALRALPERIRTLALEVHVRYDLVFAHREQTDAELRSQRAQAAELIRAIEAQGFTERWRRNKVPRTGPAIEDDTGLPSRLKSVDAIWTR